MAWLSDYYSGRAGFEDLSWRDQQKLRDTGEILRYADSSRLRDADVDRAHKYGSTIAVPDARTGRYNLIGPAADVLPGGDRIIGQQELIARHLQSQAGGRQLADPYGLGAQALQSAQNAAEVQAYKTADYLAQFLPPDRIAAEVKRMTGVDLSQKLASTPNLLDRTSKEQQMDIARANAQAQADLRRAQVTKAELDADEKARQQQITVRADIRNARNSLGNLDNLEETAQRILDNPALNRTVGPIAGRMKSVTAGATNLEAELKSLKAQVAFNALQAMRDASKTGGALGNVSNVELDRLENSLAALDLTQSPEQFRESLERVILYTHRVKSLVREGIASTYGPEAVGQLADSQRVGQLPVAARRQVEAAKGEPVRFSNGQVWKLDAAGVPTRVR